MVRKLSEIPILELGPQHDGLKLSSDQFDAAAGRDGYRFELIEGVLHVAPAPDHHAQDFALAVYERLKRLRNRGKRVFAQVKLDPRVFIHHAPMRTTNPQPDVAAYSEYPPKPVRPRTRIDPCLVVEIVTPDSRRKDYVRNADLYAQVSSILEYWIIDPTDVLERPSMTVLRRDAGKDVFERIEIAAGGAYRCKRWPGLRIDLRRIAFE